MPAFTASSKLVVARRKASTADRRNHHLQASATDLRTSFKASWQAVGKEDPVWPHHRKTNLANQACPDTWQAKARLA